MNVEINKNNNDVSGAGFSEFEKMVMVLETEGKKKQEILEKYSKKKKELQSIKDKLAIKNSEIKQLKKEISRLNQQNDLLANNLELINQKHLESVELSVDLLSDLEYNRYKASFIDIDIKLLSGTEKLKKYCSMIKKFFVNELNCTYVNISYSGINDTLKDVINLKLVKKRDLTADFAMDYGKIYIVELEDVDLTERKIGRIIIGRYPYRDVKKEDSYHKRILYEIDITKRILENSINDFQNRELAVKDALTDLYTRKYFEEKLSEEFNSLDLYGKLESHEQKLYQIAVDSDGNPESLIRNKFYHDCNTKDEELFNSALGKLSKNNIIRVVKNKYLGSIENHISFVSSKFDYNLFVAFFDLDYFKDVNDNWGGHEAGDRVLKKFSKILKQNIRTTDIPIRLGGEEFVILFPRALSQQKILNVLENIRKACENELIVAYKNKERNVTVSIGFTRISKYDKKIQHIINRADAALYKAKKRRNRIIFYEQGPDGYINPSK